MAMVCIFINEDGVADGYKLNIIVNDIVPNTFKTLRGTVIYRNSDAEFNRIVEKKTVLLENRRYASFY
jgi:putative protease